MRSAGILLCRRTAGGSEVLLVHPGGPFFAKKDAGAWSVPKGIVEADEDPLAAARRELAEETGVQAGDGPYHPLGEITQKGGKRVVAWAVAGDADPASLKSNTFELEWPPRSGRLQIFPEIDRAAWLDRARALEKIHPAQRPLVEAAFSAECVAALFGSE